MSKEPDRKRLENPQVLGKGKIKRVSWQKKEKKGACRKRESQPVTYQEKLSSIVARMVREIYNMETAYNSLDLRQGSYPIG